MIASAPSANIHCDAVFFGAGGAGLLLLNALNENGWLRDHKVVIIEPNAKTDNDRTWCFWTDRTDLVWQKYGNLVSHTWSRVANGLGRTEHLKPYTYAHLRSSDFYAHIKNQIANKVTWINSEVANVSVQNSEVIGLCSDGQVVTAPFAFDSRPLSDTEFQDQTKGSDTLWQSFFGYRVRTSIPLNADTCTLMDFNVPQNGSTQFVYTLPTGTNEGLVELTRFGKEILDEHESVPILENYITSHYGNFQIIEKEVGRIPMTLGLNAPQALHPADCKVIPIGTRAGAVKSTTGYAFKSMTNHAYAIAEALKLKQPLPTPYHSQRFTFYDRLLLRVLTRHPDFGKPIFQQLFEKRKTAEVLRFLDEKSSMPQDIKILASLPFAPFLGALSQVAMERLAMFFYPKNGFQSRWSYILVMLTIGLAIANSLWPSYLIRVSPWLLWIGLIFPGIPHGAVDHWIALKGSLKKSKLFIFVIRYVSAMVAIALLWLISPLIGFLSFLTYSAWHFGETDLRDWNSYSPWSAMLWGFGVLGTILFGHFASLESYMSWYSLGNFHEAIAPFRMGLLLLSIGAMLISGFIVHKGARPKWLTTSLVVLIGIFVPLLLAFALYFIGCHSFRGWAHLRHSLKTNSITLLRRAAPFSLGAWVLGLTIIISGHYLNFDFQDYWPLIFAFIAALSAPHVWMMHLMYNRNQAG